MTVGGGPGGGEPVPPLTPPIIHQWWVGDLPAHIETWMGRWPELHPGWEYRLWSDEFPGVLSKDLRRCWDMVPDLWRENTVARIRSNIVRYWLLLEHGGVWVDADIQPLKPIDPFRMFDCWLPWTSDRSGTYPMNAPWGSVPGHRLPAECVRDLLDAHERKARGEKVDLTGPRYVAARVGGDVTVVAEGLFNPYGWQETADYPLDTDFAALFPQAYTVHHWNYARR